MVYSNIDSRTSSHQAFIYRKVISKNTKRTEATLRKESLSAQKKKHQQKKAANEQIQTH